jgi:hypothetical protein
MKMIAYEVMELVKRRPGIKLYKPLKEDMNISELQ